MKILHTSDWHLGHHLFDKSRKQEHDLFLDWLIDMLDAQNVDIVIVAGDIFDNGFPSNYALKQYYNFLRRLPNTPCSNLIIIGGNHDSPSTLNAPRNLLKFLNIYVVGGVEENLSKEIIICKKNDKPLGIVCAVPFIRPRDINRINPGESYSLKEDYYKQGVILHYKNILEKAIIQKAKLYDNIPIISTGHLYTAGESIKEAGSERDLYIGNQGKIPLNCFHDNFDYVALGHIHEAQKINKKDYIRYSGSPIPLSFGEASKNKSVTIIEFKNEKLVNVENISVPLFRDLLFINGDVQHIEKQINHYSINNKYNLTPWLELLIHNDKSKFSDELIKEIAKEKQLEVIRSALFKESPKTFTVEDSPELSDMTSEDVFIKLCELKKIDENQQKGLVKSFRELLQIMDEEPD